MDKIKVDSFWKRRSIIEDPDIATHYKIDDTINYDLEFIGQYLNGNTNLLELGCGSCRLVNRLESNVATIVGVEKQEGLLRFCLESSKIRTYISDIVDYKTEDKYDLIIIFGVLNYLSEEDVNTVYKNCYEMLANDGKILIKHSCGIYEDVIVDKYSEAIGDWYHAIYRWIEKDQNLLENANFKVEICDIYPSRLNPWPNTHFYAFVGSK